MSGGNSRQRRKYERASERTQRPSTPERPQAAPSTSTGTSPFYESALFWGCASAAIAIVLTVVGAMKKDLRLLLAFALPFAIIAAWVMLRPLLSRWQTWAAVAVTSLVLVFMLYQLYGWLAPSPDIVEIEYPHLDPQLVVDQKNGPGVASHIEIENIGKWQVDNIRSAAGTPEMMSVDNLPSAPTLPSHGHLSIPVPPLFRLDKGGVLFDDLTYTSNINGTTSGFRSHYSFIVPPIDATPRTIRPSEWQESAGALEDEREQIGSIVKRLSDPQGTLVMAVPERNPDGSPNLIVLANDKKIFLFDPTSHLASFQITIEHGRRKIVSQPFPASQNGAHIIAFAWNTQGVAKLMVDGKGSW